MEGECLRTVNQHIAKEAIEDMSAKIELLLSNHQWSPTKIDEEAYVGLDLVLQVLIVMWHNSGRRGLQPCCPFIAWATCLDTTGTIVPWMWRYQTMMIAKHIEFLCYLDPGL